MDSLQNNPPHQEATPPSRTNDLWAMLLQAGLADVTLRLGTHVLLVALILFFAWGLREFYLLAEVVPTFRDPLQGLAAAPDSMSLQGESGDITGSANLSELISGADPIAPTSNSGIVRRARLHTDVPSRPRQEVIEYTVQEGDTLFGIAAKFGLQPETVLWANQVSLGDNPHNLRPGQKLNILPVDGTYHRWAAGDGLNGVAKFFGVTPEAIVAFPVNKLDPQTIGDYANPNIEPGTWLVIPGGRRAFVSWSAPAIPRDNPGVAAVLGPGACEGVINGAIGSGVFIWPTNSHLVTGYDYVPEANHPGIDLEGNEGDPVYAADSGVIVYAGWNSWGYGNVIVINHGNGWQTLYAHLSAYYVSCGQSIIQGGVIGAVGNTGNSTGAHLHFEMMFETARVNPHDYLR